MDTCWQHCAHCPVAHINLGADELMSVLYSGLMTPRIYVLRTNTAARTANTLLQGKHVHPLHQQILLVFMYWCCLCQVKCFLFFQYWCFLEVKSSGLHKWNEMKLAGHQNHTQKHSPQHSPLEELKQDYCYATQSSTPFWLLKQYYTYLQLGLDSQYLLRISKIPWSGLKQTRFTVTSDTTYGFTFNQNHNLFLTCFCCLNHRTLVANRGLSFWWLCTFYACHPPQLASVNISCMWTRSGVSAH